MTDSKDDTPLTLDDEQIVTRRTAIGLVALALGAAGTLVSRPAAADDSSEASDGASDASGDTASDASGDAAESDDSTEEEKKGDAHEEKKGGGGDGDG